MKVKKIVQAAGLAIAAFLTVGANGNWTLEVNKTDRGHAVGNPEAENRLIEFVSYSCGHCAHFTYQGEGALQIAYVGPGKLIFEHHPIIRNEADLVATMLVQCGDKGRYTRNHTMFMYAQNDWLPKFTSANAVQRSQWNDGKTPESRRSIANALGFYPMMETRGYSRTEIDLCLNDNAEAERLEANTQADFEEYGLAGTPSFALNGELLKDVHSWAALVPYIGKGF